jgi:uncharacterized repeat protein (TIGR03803 family)
MQLFQGLRLRKRSPSRYRRSGAISARARVQVREFEPRITPSLVSTSLVAPYGITCYGTLLMDGSGNLYGTAANGGASGVGTVFELVHGSGTLTTLATFNGANGANPHSSLILDASGNLYGTTAAGGSANDGTVFELASGSGTITTLASFTGTNGANPEAGLVMDASGNLYGTTTNAGASNDGTVFEVAAGSGAITALASFNGANGANPMGVLILDGSGNLHGTTANGGASSDGTVFEVVAGSGAITALASFTGSNGAHPQAGLVMDGSGNLYGTAADGGASNQGTVFEVLHGSGTLTALVSFNDPTNGAYPQGSLVMDSSGNLYGTTENGPILNGAIRQGSVFELTAGSGTLTTLAAFWGTRGVNPLTGLAMDGSDNLYGTTQGQNENGFSKVFELAPATRTVTVLAQFSHPTGSYPLAGVVMDGSGNLYGTAAFGGAFGAGTVFELAAGSGGITALASFNGSNGTNPEGNMVIDGSGNLYGTTRNGGAYGDGTVFELAAGSGTITTLASFNGTNGSGPLGGLLLDGSGNLYGTTTGGGAAGYGAVFEVVHGRGAITTLASFPGGNEQDPEECNLIMDGQGNLYGTAEARNSGYYGAVFEVAAGSGKITTLAAFNRKTGSLPVGGVVMDSHGNLYGVTDSGGTSGDGTVFEVVAGSGKITTLASFNGTDGANPYAGLTMDGSGNLHGTAQGGGASGDGTVFEVAAGSHTITTLASFNGTNGAGPVSTLIMDGSGNLYGTTTSGGGSGLGVVFEVTAGNVPSMARIVGRHGRDADRSVALNIARSGDAPMVGAWNAPDFTPPSRRETIADAARDARVTRDATFWEMGERATSPEVLDRFFASLAETAWSDPAAGWDW